MSFIKNIISFQKPLIILPVPSLVWLICPFSLQLYPICFAVDSSAVFDYLFYYLVYIFFDNIKFFVDQSNFGIRYDINGYDVVAV